MAKGEIDRVTAEFFGAFDNCGGRPADLARLRGLLLPGAVVVRTGAELVVYSVEEFIAPRDELLNGGRLVEFREWETSERTEVSGDVACRIGTYRKSGILDGEPYTGGGTKTFQFVRTPGDEWRIAAFSWSDAS